jgi:hypothetical protein
LDPDRSNIISCFGRKGSGKSNAAELIYDSYPHDKAVIDVTGDANPVGAELITDPLPKAFPRRELTDPDKPLNLRYRADTMSPTLHEDLDKAVGTFGLFPADRKKLLWVDEVAVLTKANKTGPHLRTLLLGSRHFGPASAIFCGPRPLDIDTLVLAQSDYVFIYDLPAVQDREKVALTIGYPVQKFHQEHDETVRRGEFWYLLFVARPGIRGLYRCPPLPQASTAGPRS